ncbi:MAG TPA: ADP-ribosylation factor-like protein [bacterium]|nr:ADP-ribosylation factor-like protein [bacterium]
MPEILDRTRQLKLRLVYYGPPRSGKAVNLQRIFELSRPEARSRMVAFDAGGNVTRPGADRRVSFEMTLPPETPEGWTVVVEISALSSPLLMRPTKIATLERADAVAFVADATRERREENHEAFREAEELLRARTPPIVLQVNKRDRADALSEDEIEREWGARSWPIFTAAAKQGDGVRETFTCLLRLAFEGTDKGAGLEAMTSLTLSGVTTAALKALRRAEAE